jgi:hypothetical protein
MDLVQFFRDENQQLMARLNSLEEKARKLDEAFLNDSKAMTLPHVDLTFRAQQHQNNTLREFLAKIAAKIQADHDYLEIKKKKAFS